MFVRKCVFVFLLLVSFSFFPGFTWSADEEAAGLAAEQAGKLREALNNYTTALQATSPGSEAEQRLLERAAAISSKVTPLPALPAEAERRMVRGQALVESAKDADAFLRAASEFRAAVRAAPWLADAHYNLGVVLDKAQRFDEAIRSLKLSILIAPNSKEAGEAQRLIYRIEVRQEEGERAKERAQKEMVTRKEEAQRAKAEDERKAEQQRVARQREEEERNAIQKRFVGTWYTGDATRGEMVIRYEATVIGNKFEIRAISAHFEGKSYQVTSSFWRGTIEGVIITGTFLSDGSERGGGSYARPMKGSISQDGQTLRLKYKVVVPDGSELDNEKVLRR